MTQAMSTHMEAIHTFERDWVGLEPTTGGL
jgi:hypothetical protein